MGRAPKDRADQQIYSQLEILRVAAGLSRQELADQVGVHYQTVGYLERGEYSPSLVLALRIAHVLGTDVESVFSLEPFESTTVRSKK
jgi:DNA-binding XRE family transcriptional regulator